MTTFSKFSIRFPAIKLLTGLALGLLAACTSIQVNVSNKMFIPFSAKIGVAGFANHSDTPLANRQLETMVAGLMRSRGFVSVKMYEHTKSCAKLLYCPDETMSRSQALSWARSNGFAYVFTGAANEWRYKVGLDGEPVAGASLSLINVRTGQIVWSAVGSIVGGSRSGLDVSSQRLLNWIINNNIAPIY